MIIESAKNQKVKDWKKLHTRKGREKAQSYLIEGPHIVEEAAKFEAPIIEVIITEETDLSAYPFKERPVVYTVSEKVMQELTDTETPQGIMAVCKIAEAQLPSTGKFLLLDAIQDPGNLGTIIRTADSAGYDGILLGQGTVDAYNSKVLRSTQGSLYHLPVKKGSLVEEVQKFKALNMPIYATEVSGGTPYQELVGQSQFAVILGNEANGVSKELQNLADEKVYIPIYGKAESLNVAVAAGILMYGLLPS
ncbi:TrmH family RNA methyltransferase [Guptibacillus spartinae]|uniref:TrmH family RNA methyltransferase n=1 Tax=Guptibacillus spartinae TaxID=3025679 RepID=UPI002360ECF9|nr:RNA methyltransferase [Pseudalkalibacillus spartinae]